MRQRPGIKFGAHLKIFKTVTARSQKIKIDAESQLPAVLHLENKIYNLASVFFV